MDKKGFTLIEVLVSLFIFMILVGAITSAFITTIRTQQHILVEQKMFSEISYALEYMGRSLRLAQKDIAGNCLGSALKGNNYLITYEGRRIRFLNWDGQCQEFTIMNSSIQERISPNSSYCSGCSHFSITSSDINIERLKFNSGGSNYGQGVNQPKVVIAINLRSENLEIPMRIQTLVSQRKLNVVISP